MHAFGAYFGLAAALMLRPAADQNDAGKHEGANYVSDIFAMIGTTFLWVYWPSFNSVLAEGTGGERAILHTFLSLAAATGESRATSASTVWAISRLKWVARKSYIQFQLVQLLLR